MKSTSYFLRIGRPKEYYEDIMTKINGYVYRLHLATNLFWPIQSYTSVLFPGGDADFNRTDGYAAAGRHILDIAIRMNDEGDVMPVFGTCLGFELLAYLTSKGGNPLVNCSSQMQTLPLDFVAGLWRNLFSLFFKNLC